MLAASDLDAYAADGFGWWLAGLIDGEGCFSVSRNGPGHRCELHVRARDDDAPTLEALVERTGLGVVRYNPAQGRGAPSARWVVARHDHLQSLVELLDRFPGRTRKFADEYPLWREAVSELVGDAKTNFDRMADLSAQLRQHKRYDPQVSAGARGGEVYVPAPERTRTLHCRRGDHSWEYVVGPGRPPGSCPEHA